MFEIRLKLISHFSIHVELFQGKLVRVKSDLLRSGLIGSRTVAIFQDFGRKFMVAILDWVVAPSEVGYLCISMVSELEKHELSPLTHGIKGNYSTTLEFDNHTDYK